MMTADTMMKRARAALILDHPFFGALALRLAIVPDAGVETAATDGRVIRYNPAFIESLRPDQVRGVIAHEVMHCATGHQWRRSGRDHGQWNVAADYAVNPILIDAGLALPDGALIDGAYRDQAAETIYGALAQRRPEPSPDGEPGPGDDGQSQDNGAPGDGPGQPDPGGCGAVIDAPADDGQGNAMTEADWRVATVQAAKNAAMQAGRLPAEIARLVDRMTDRSLDWRTILADFVQRCARNDYDWARPSPRFAHRGVVLPTLRSNELPAIVIAIDTSGSIDAAALARFLPAVSDALGAYETTAHVICCDAQVQSVAEFTTADLPIDVEPAGGGGTDFRPVFAWVNDHDVEPAALIYFTDLDCCDWPDAEPDYPVLWVTPGPVYSSAPWGDVITMPKGGA